MTHTGLKTILEGLDLTINLISLSLAKYWIPSQLLKLNGINSQ